MKYWVPSCVCIASSFVLFAQDPPPPEVVDEQLEEAEEDFKEAKEMFDPWYAGPLLTGSAHTLAPGLFNVQPYLFFTQNYAEYDEHGHSHSISNLNQVNPQLPFEFGITKWMDSVITVQGLGNYKNGHSAWNIGDTSVSLRFALLHEGPYNPALLFSVKESFPTGKYQRLNPHRQGVDGIGSGSFATTFTFNMSKVVWWVSDHPMNVRLSLNYTVPAPVHVHGYNVYGGGSGTRGKAYPGSGFQGDIGYEYSFTQRWVAALDIVYTYNRKTRFSGHKGVDSSGAPASVGGPFNDQLSLAPALEYNPNANVGIIAGTWFTVWGRNAFNFVSEIISVTWTF
jgi:hypothetical protein